MDFGSSPGCTATGIGSLPVDLARRGRVIDPRETARLVADLFPHVPHIVELPGRGAGADMIGRSAALLAAVSSDFAVHTVPTGWRRTSKPGIDLERASRFLDEDFDAIAEVFADYSGVFKLQICGPLTWCRSVEDFPGEPTLRDSGFVADVFEATAEVARMQMARLRRLLPKVTTLVLQIDEPSLPQVLRGTVPTASGRGRITAPDEHLVRDAYAGLVRGIRADDAAGRVWLHSCADDSHVDLATRAGFDGVSFDVTTLKSGSLDSVGATFETGMTVVIGAFGPDDWQQSASQLKDVALGRVERLRNALSIPADSFAAQVVLSPTCGLAGAGARGSRMVMRAVADAAKSVSGETMSPGSSA